MGRCCIVHCGLRKNKNQPELTLHRFPKNEALKTKWLDIIGVENINPRHKEHFVCSLHFEEISFNRTLDVVRLRDDAVPSNSLVAQKSPWCDQASTSKQDTSLPPSTSVANQKNLLITTMSKVLCRICLRTDVQTRDIAEDLVDLHDEMCDYDIYRKKAFKYCTICEHQLKKVYNFRKKCNEANKILKNLRQKKLTEDFPNDLHEQLSPPSLGICDRTARHQLYEYVYSDSDLDPKPDLDLRPDIDPRSDTDLRPDPVKPDDLNIDLIKTEVDEDKGNYTFVTKDQTDNIYRINFEEVLQKNEFLEKFENVLEKNELEETNLSLQLLDEEDLPLSDLKEESESLEYLSDLENETDKQKIKSKKLKPTKLKTKLTKIKYEEIDDLSLAELIDKCGTDDKTVKAKQKFLKNKAKLKDRILELLDGGQFEDLGDNVTMNKDIFLKIFDRYDKCDMRMLTIKPGSPELPQKLKKFLLYLLKKYNPEYETIFHVEYLDTDEKKLQEFNRRKDGKWYIESPFKCELCYKGFDAQSHLDYHNKWHKPTPNDIVCNICPMRFVSKSTYKAHRKNNHTVVYACKQCPVVTYHFSVMINHYNQHKGVEYHCPTCLSVYTNKTTLNNHRREAHATCHICTACARSFVSEKGLFFHKKFKHKDAVEVKPEETATCLQCNITFDTHKVYLKHERSAHRRRPDTVYKCYFCKEGFDSIEALRKHKLELSHQRAPKQVIHRSSIVPRTRGARGSRRPPVEATGAYRKCTLCLMDVPNTFPTSLYMHYQEMHPEIPYNSVYTDSKDYLCELCGKTFRVYCHYLDHKNQHTGAKPYLCKECPAQFATRKHLVYHSERHRPPRYQCKQCGKLFLSAANLFAHRRGHIGDRRFKCEICFKGFLHSYTLKEHIKGVHNQIRRVRKVPNREKSLI